jgi:N-methylhydantoinase B
MTRIDPITLEVIEASFVNIVREMRATLIRTSFSPILYEVHDFSCALLNPEGELIGLSEDIPLHIFPTCFHVRKMVEKFGDEIYPGDLILSNDPYTGGTHLNDVALAYPYFVEGRLILFIMVRAHFADVGGMTPGSISGKVTEIYQEGIRIPLVKIYERGKPNEALTETIFANMRFPEEREGDYFSMLDTCRTAERRLNELIAKYGAEMVEQCMAAGLERAEARMKEIISGLTPGEYYHESYLESTGTSGEPLPMRVTLKVKDGTMDFDFTGTAPQVVGATNTGPAIPSTAVFIAVKSFLDPLSKVSGGSFRPIKVFAPEGTFINARLPAPCGAMSEVERPLCGLVIGVLSQIIPQEITGEPRMGSNHTYIGGWDPARGRPFLFYEYPTGGTPAFREGDGSNAVFSYNSGDVISIYPIEVMENKQPLRVEILELRQDGGGAGYHRGGLGLRREIRLLAEAASLSVLAERTIIPINGVSRGNEGARNAFNVVRDGMEIPPSDIPGKVTGFPMIRGDILVMETHGGGGYGDPLTRDPELVKEDVLNGYVSLEMARESYGVVFSNDDVDVAKTEELRRKKAAERHYVKVITQENDAFDKRGSRLCPLSSPMAARLGVADGYLVEYFAEEGYPLRAWVKVEDTLGETDTPLGPLGRKILKVKDGDLIEIRTITDYYAKSS